MVYNDKHSAVDALVARDRPAVDKAGPRLTPSPARGRGTSEAQVFRVAVATPRGGQVQLPSLALDPGWRRNRFVLRRELHGTAPEPPAVVVSNDPIVGVHQLPRRMFGFEQGCCCLRVVQAGVLSKRIEVTSSNEGGHLITVVAGPLDSLDLTVPSAVLCKDHCFPLFVQY